MSNPENTPTNFDAYVAELMKDPAEAAAINAAREAITAKRGIADIIVATIEVFERECPADDFDTENGIGIPDDVDPVQAEIVEITVESLVFAPSTLDDLVQRELDNLGIGQWDGGITAYDPDGSSMAPDGTITERWGLVTYAEGIG